MMQRKSRMDSNVVSVLKTGMTFRSATRSKHLRSLKSSALSVRLLWKNRKRQPRRQLLLKMQQNKVINGTVQITEIR